MKGNVFNNFIPKNISHQINNMFVSIYRKHAFRRCWGCMETIQTKTWFNKLNFHWRAHIARHFLSHPLILSVPRCYYFDGDWFMGIDGDLMRRFDSRLALKMREKLENTRQICDEATTFIGNHFSISNSINFETFKAHFLKKTWLN